MRRNRKYWEAAASVVAEDLRARAVLEISEGEEVSPVGFELDAFGLGAEGARGLLGFLAPERQQRDAAGLLADEPAGYGLAHEAIAAQDQDVLSADVHAGTLTMFWKSDRPAA